MPTKLIFFKIELGTVIIWQPILLARNILYNSLQLAQSILTFLFFFVSLTDLLIIVVGSIPVSATLPAKIDNIVCESLSILLKTSFTWLKVNKAVILRLIPNLDNVY